MSIIRDAHPYKESVNRNQYTVINCKKCGYWHVHPIPTEDELEAYYKNKYYKILSESDNRTMIDKLNDPDGFYAMQYEDRLRYIKKVFPPDLPKTVIDIGAGYGDFMAFMKKNGWNVQGVEPSKDAYQSIKDETLGIKLGSIDKLYMKLKPSSLVTINNVLEHVREPQKVLEIVHKHLLQPEGILSIIVPNDFNILQDLLMKGILKNNPEKQYYWVAPPDHLNYWSLKTIKKFLERCGFKVLDRITDFPMEIFPLMGDDYINYPEIGRKAHLRRVKFEQYLHRANLENFKDLLFKSFTNLGMGRVMQVLATPKYKDH